MTQLPLAGIRVLDLSRLLPGPYCTLLLADMGAEVVKIETPGLGDYARLIPPHLGGDASFRVVNRNKKSVALNYRNARGLQIFLRLARSCDVVLESFRPGSVERWGMGYEAVKAVNPGVIYCSLSGYGQSGPYRERAGHDLNYLALGGLLGLNGAAGGPPIPPGVQIADLAGGMLAATAILGALVGRARNGEGAYLDVSMFDATVSWVASLAGANFLRTGQNPLRGQTTLSGRLPCYNVYETEDGKYLAVSALEPHFWSVFCNTLERQDLNNRQFDPDLVDELAALFRGRTQAAWLETFHEADACVEAVYELDEMVHDRQVRHRALVVEAKTQAEQIGPTGLMFGSPFQHSASGGRAPELGEHTHEVLAGAGLSDAEIQELAAAKIIRIAPASE